MTWKCGVDVLAFGATKNGALGVEAIVSFDPALTEALHFRRKRSGHLASKMRFLAAQMDAYLEDGLWLRNAAHANAMAARLAAGFGAIPSVRILASPQANMFFARLPPPLGPALRAEGFRFYDDRRDPATVRLVTSFATTPQAVDTFIEAARRLA
jgi:threonine aldolase